MAPASLGDAPTDTPSPVAARPGPPALGERDRVTGLPTKVAFAAWLAAMVKARTPGCAVLIDLDGFARVNDAQGRGAGDRVLAQAADRLSAVLPEGAALAHRGGDEFLVLLPQVDAAAARGWVESARAQLRAPCELPRGEPLSLSASAGIVVLDGSGVDELLRSCDVAMYAAKARGRDRSVVYDQDTRRFLARRREVSADLQELQARRASLQGQAHTDADTGLGDRQALDELLATTLEPDGPLGAQAALARIEIDRCTGGAEAGDASWLSAVAVTLRRRARDADRLFRAGPHAFVIVYPGLSGESAYVAAERLRDAVETLALSHPAGGIVTVTIGVASGRQGLALRRLDEAAAGQITQARQGGGDNRVRAVAPGPEA